MCIRDSLTAADGSVIPADGLIEIVFCSTEGTAAFQTDLPFGKYYVEEVATDQHYLLSEETYPVDFTYQGQDTAVVHISANEGNAIENELIRGKISGKKVDTDGEALEGATIGLFSAGAEEFTEETALMVKTSDEDVYKRQLFTGCFNNLWIHQFHIQFKRIIFEIGNGYQSS